MIASLNNVRCHTCRFNPDHREETLAQILQPCTLSFTVSQNEGHGMRVNANISDLCLNVSPHSIFIIQNSVQAFIESMGTQENAKKNSIDKGDEYEDLWATKRFENEEFWFLKPEETKEAIDVVNSLNSNAAILQDQQAILRINNLVIKIESGLGNNTIPLLLLESTFECDLKNWASPQMSLLGRLDLEMAYYNSNLALWEPVIEPICQMKPDGSIDKRRWDMLVSLQSNASNDYGSAFVSPNFDEADGFMCPENMPPLMVIGLESKGLRRRVASAPPGCEW